MLVHSGMPVLILLEVAMAAQPLIMVVEDDADSRALLRLVISMALPAAEIVETPCIADARTVLQSTTLTVVITDYRLPDGTGIELIKAIREVDASLPVLANSADIQVARAMLQAGATLFVAKPYDVVQLVSQLRTLVGVAMTVAISR